MLNGGNYSCFGGPRRQTRNGGPKIWSAVSCVGVMQGIEEGRNAGVIARDGRVPQAVLSGGLLSLKPCTRRCPALMRPKGPICFVDSYGVASHMDPHHAPYRFASCVPTFKILVKNRCTHCNKRTFPSHGTEKNGPLAKSLC